MPTMAMRRASCVVPPAATGYARVASITLSGVAVAELAQPLVRVLAEGGREAGDAGRRRGELDRRGERADAAAAVAPAFDDGRVGLDLRMREDLLQRVHAAYRDIVRLEEGDPVGALARAEDVAQDGHDGRAVPDAEVVGREARVGEQVFAADRGAEPLPEGVGEASDDEVAVARREGLVRHQVGVAAPELAVLLAVGEHVRRHVGEERDDGVEHRHLDPLARAGAVALDQRRADAERRVDARGDVRDRRRGLDGRATLLAGVAHETARRLQDQVHAWLLREWAARPEGSDRAVDEARVRGVERLGAEAVALHHAGAEILDQYVRLRDQPAHQRGARLLADVDGEPTLVAVQPLEVEAADLGREAAGAVGVADAVAAAGLLHLDDVGAQVAEQRRAPRARRLVREVDDTDASQRRVPLRHAPAFYQRRRRRVHAR